MSKHNSKVTNQNLIEISNQEKLNISYELQRLKKIAEGKIIMSPKNYTDPNRYIDTIINSKNEVNYKQIINFKNQNLNYECKSKSQWPNMPLEESDDNDLYLNSEETEEIHDFDKFIENNYDNFDCNHEELNN